MELMRLTKAQVTVSGERRVGVYTLVSKLLKDEE